MDIVVAARQTGDPEVEIRSLRACLEHPCSAHQFQVAELWAELGDAYRRMGRFDAAIEARERAIENGYRSVPHPRAEIAEVLLESGRRLEADALFAELRAQCQDDVWLYNSAGFSYADADDHEEALSWLDTGIELALATGDPEDLLDQLVNRRQASTEALGRETSDELSRKAAAFERPPGYRHGITDYYGGENVAPVRCGHCGWDPAEEEPTGMALAEVEALSEAVRRSWPRSAPNTPSGRGKVGRNQPCPCGSGRKFKRCHGSV